MKKLLVLAFFFASSAQAGQMSEISFMAIDSAAETLGLSFNYKVKGQKFIPADYGFDLAVETQLTTLEPVNGKTEWTCATQFMGSTFAYQVSHSNCY